MKKTLLTLLTSFLLVNFLFSQEIIKPEEFFGFRPGSDRMLFDYEQLISWLKCTDEASERMEMREIGKSPEGKTMYLVFISSPENIKNLDQLKSDNEKLAMDPGLSSSELAKLKENPVFIMATLSMHSTEVGPTQAFPLIAWELCTTNDKDKLEWLENTVFMVVPNHNPDGMDMIVNYYNKTKDTKNEGTSMPGVYHKYVGHDNNRDFVILSQSDTKAIAKVYNKEWYPQVFVEKHQMGITDTRYFVPPNHDPIAENVDEGVWNWIGIFGANLIKDMTAAGQSGVSQHYLFDNYWPGSTETCIWKNMVGFLTECASAKVATPVYVEPTEISVDGKGLAEYKKSVNMPLPWEGGWWRLGDIVDYEIVSTWSVLNTASINRKELLQYRNDLCKKQVKLGQTTAPYYYVMPASQHDQSELVYVVNLLKEHGIKVYELQEDFREGDKILQKGDVIIPMAQPYRAFIKEVMEKQEYPERHYMPGGEVIQPYDITTWSLPLHNGIKSFEIKTEQPELMNLITEIKREYSIGNPPSGNSAYWIFSSDNNESYKAAFLALSKNYQTGRVNEDQKSRGQKIPAGSFVIKTPSDHTAQKNFLSEFLVAPLATDSLLPFTEIKMPKIALVESYFHDMDAGWTRFVLDSYHIPYKTWHPGDIASGSLSEIDILIFPDEDKSVLMEGKYKRGDSYSISSYATEFTKGIGKEGMAKIARWIDEGGKIISWGGSVSLFEGSLSMENEKQEKSRKNEEEKTNKEEFQLPFKEISESLQKEGVYCPGSLVRLKLSKDNPLSLGMEEETAIFYRGKPVFSTYIPMFDMDRRVIGKLPEKDILLSGYMEKEKMLGNKPVMIWLKKGEGQLVLMGFSPQFRASTHASYKLLFNSILLGDFI